MGFSPLQLTFIDEKGDFYTLCPVIPRKLLLSQEAFHSIMDYCRETEGSNPKHGVLEKILEDKRDTLDGKYRVEIGERISDFEPLFAGPIELSNSRGFVAGEIPVSIKCVSDFPSSLIRLTT
jgi:hypothetical protein